jgi:hypothetical protein
MNEDTVVYVYAFFAILALFVVGPIGIFVVRALAKLVGLEKEDSEKADTNDSSANKEKPI